MGMAFYNFGNPMGCKIFRANGKILCAFLIGIVVCGAGPQLSWCAQPAVPQRVLVLMPFDPSRPAAVQFRKGLQTGLETRYPGNVEIVMESVASIPPDPEDFRNKVTDWIAFKYARQEFDAIVAVRQEPSQIAAALRDRCWPRAKLVTVLFDEDLRLKPVSIPRSTRIQVAIDNDATIRSALRMLPETRRVAILGGVGLYDDAINASILKSIREINPRLEVIDLTGLTLEEAKTRVSSLPNRTILVIGGFMFDRAGRHLGAPELIGHIAPAANAPVFHDTDQAMGEGIVGGAVMSIPGASVIIGERLAQLLNGADPESLSTARLENSFIVDWRQVKRWHISPNTLPANATILYREPSVWAQYRRYILGTLAILLLLLGMIAFLLLERRRRRKEERLNSAMLESLPGVALLVSPRGEILRTNQKDASSLGTIPAPASGGPSRNRYDVYLRSLAGEQSAPNAALAVEEVIAGKRPNATVELPLPNQEKWLEIRAISLPEPKGGSLIVHLDITQRKEAEQEQNRSREDIYHLNRVAAIGQLAGSLAHELSQPLAAILSNAQAAQRFADRPEPDLQEIKEALEDITRDDRRARSIIQEMRSLMKKEAISRRPVDLNAIVRSLVQILKSESQRAEVRVELELAESELTVLGDWGPLQQVLLNLLQNGMDAMQNLPPEARCLTVKTEANTAVGTASLYVKDNGPGIAEEIRARLFEPFVSTKKDGLGLGLSICHSILASLGGKIDLQNGATPGATFCIDLPLVTASVPVGAPDFHST
jgi:signal transduction histidine kinase